MKSFLRKFSFTTQHPRRWTKVHAKTSPERQIVHEPIPLPGNLLQRLHGLRRRHKLVGLTTGFSKMVGAICLLLLAQGISDWWFDLPWIARAGFFLADIVLLGSLYRSDLDTALRKRLGLAETALMVEKKWPQLQQSVIASVELSGGARYSTRGSRQLLDVMLEQARARTTSLNFNEVVSTLALRRWLILGGAALLATGAVAVTAWPASLTLLQRIFLLNVPLPTRTIVIPITRDLVTPLGSDVEISAMAQGVIPTNGRITVTYATGAPQEFPVKVDPEKPATFSFTLHNVQTDFRYSFHLNDGHGPEFTVKAKTPPSLKGLACEEIFPDYTGLTPRKLAPTELALLVGSHLHVEATCHDALKSATIVLQGLTKTIDATLSEGRTHLEADIPIPAKDLTGFSIHLLDDSGVSSSNETIYPITLVPDNPPLVKIVEPVDDQESITLRAKPVIAFEASDDYGLAKLSINYQLIPPMIPGEQDARPPSEVESIPVEIKPANAGRNYEFILDVASQAPAWQEGYSVNYWVEATDNNTATGPGITRTEHKQFSVVSIETKQAEFLKRLKENAAEIDSLSGTTQKISNDVGETIPRK